MNCQQICKILRKKTTKVNIFQKVFGGYFLNTLYSSSGVQYRSAFGTV